LHGLQQGHITTGANEGPAISLVPRANELVSTIELIWLSDAAFNFPTRDHSPDPQHLAWKVDR
jgi:hypothetical protein